MNIANRKPKYGLSFFTVQLDSISLANFNGFSFLSSFPSAVSRLAFTPSNFLLLTGRLADFTIRASIATPSFMLNPLSENWFRISQTIISNLPLISLFLNFKKVEWSGDASVENNLKNVWKDLRSLIWLSSSGSDLIKGLKKWLNSVPSFLAEDQNNAYGQLFAQTRGFGQTLIIKDGFWRKGLVKKERVFKQCRMKTLTDKSRIFCENSLIYLH